MSLIGRSVVVRVPLRRQLFLSLEISIIASSCSPIRHLDQRRS